MSIPWPRDARRVLVDSSAYYASINRKAALHKQVLDTFAHLGSQRRQLFTTNFIVAETHALTLNRLGRDIAARMLGWIDDSATTIIHISKADERRAREIIFTHDDKDYSFTDATSFAVMERLRIGAAFTFDRHFVQYGFAVLGSVE
jgi:uncharacterized protein